MLSHLHMIPGAASLKYGLPHGIVSRRLQTDSTADFASRLQGRVSFSDGIRVHAHIIESGLALDTFLGNLLISMYARCRALDDARLVFDKMCQRNVVSWTAMIDAYSRQGHYWKAIQLHRQMQEANVEPDEVAFMSVLGACAGVAALPKGKFIHASIIDAGFQENVVMGTALINMYCKCRAMEAAQCVFDKMNHRNVVSWNALITGYTDTGLSQDALKVFQKLEQEGVMPTRATFLSILNACASLEDLAKGKALHASIIEGGFDVDVLIGTALINLYGKCKALVDAGSVFDRMKERTVVSWTAMIGANAQQGCHEGALQLFQQMQHEGLKPDKVTFVSVVSACSGLKALAKGEWIHACVVKNGYETDVMVGNALLTMYGNCGNLEDACLVFNKMQDHTVVSWNAMISVYVQQGHEKEAFLVYEKLQQSGIEPDKITYTSIMSACASLTGLIDGRFIHACIVHSGYELDVIVGNALVNMYGRCGAMEDASSSFLKLQLHNVISWTAMIAAYAQQGHGKAALQLFKQMQQENVKPNEVTFIAILSACSHTGLVDEGRCSFVSMSQNHSITPMLEHYVCMVDLLGRAGCLDEAEELIRRMPLECHVFGWLALLGACKVHRDVSRGDYVADHILDLDPLDATVYILLSDMHAADFINRQKMT